MRLRTYRDEKGRLWVGQPQRSLPFTPKIYLWAVAFWAFLLLCAIEGGHR